MLKMYCIKNMTMKYYMRTKIITCLFSLTYFMTNYLVAEERMEKKKNKCKAVIKSTYFCELILELKID